MLNVNLKFSEADFIEPVYVEMRTGEVYGIPKEDWDKNGTQYKFRNVPIYDSPVLIADKSLIHLKNNRKK